MASSSFTVHDAFTNIDRYQSFLIVLHCRHDEKICFVPLPPNQSLERAREDWTKKVSMFGYQPVGLWCGNSYLSFDGYTEDEVRALVRLDFEAWQAECQFMRDHPVQYCKVLPGMNTEGWDE